MDNLELQVLRSLLETSGGNQRSIAESCECSLGAANKALRALQEQGLIDKAYRPTAAALADSEDNRPKRAVILAAGYGLRMIPINQERPKGLLEIDGEPIIEHTIRQLREAGIEEIRMIVGYMKERYEYLTDKFGVTLQYCPDYLTKNNLYSLAMAREYIRDAYVVPSDVYCYINPFRRVETSSWYMLSREETEETDVRANRAGEVLYIPEGETGNRIVGIAYLRGADADAAAKRLEELTRDGRNSSLFWEEALREGKKFTIPARLVNPQDTVEIDTYEQLREINYQNSQLQNNAIEAIKKAFNISYEEIRDVTDLKKGLTNRSFIFTVHGARYIMRVPGEGTEAFINRANEGRVYEMLKGLDICDDNVYFDAEHGYKIARFIENARTCRDEDPEDVRNCMKVARRFHELKLKTEEPAFDLFDIVEYYENLWEGRGSQYRDYAETRAKAMAMKPFVRKYAHEYVLTHQDMVPDNFLISRKADGSEKIDLIDWEYSAMFDPLADLAAFITYRQHDNPREYTDFIIDAYFPEGCSPETRLLVYCYVALWGLYNSNWCEYRMALGVELGEFPMTEYRYAKTFCRVFEEEYKKLSEKGEET